MKYIVQDSEGKKMVMTVVSSMPQLPEGWSVLGLADDLPEAIAEIEAATQADSAKATAKQFLADSDWKVLRHRDQIALGIATSMTEEEMTALQTARQAARDLI
jgi:hypothetical protein